MAQDFRVTTTFRTSRKRKRLRRRLGDAGIVALLDLWGYATAERPDGDLAGLTDEDIADEAGWDDDPATFVDALAECGFIDTTPDGGRALHGWAERQPWVSSAPARSDAGKRAVHERWANRGRCKGGTPYCDDRCLTQRARDEKPKPNENEHLYGTYTGVLRTDTNRNTPIPVPVPIPKPVSIKAEPREKLAGSLPDEKTKPVIGRSKPLAERDDMDELLAPEVEVAMHEAGIGGYVGARLSHHLVALCPIHAWHLRHGIGETLEAEAKGPGAQKYVARVISRLRNSGEEPPPRARKAVLAAAGARPGVQPTIADKRASDANLWRQAAKAAGYPPNEGWVTEQGDKGPPGPDDIALLEECNGDWTTYFARADAGRDEAMAIMRALADGMAMPAV
jgi:hypothetical protein